MMKLIKQAEIYSPEPIGKKDVLIGGGKILAIEDEINLPENLKFETINAEGLKMIPGLIDAHVHIAGAGGEGGPATRTPELQLSQLIDGGITTVIGCLGTDGFTRNQESVLMKVKSLRAEGVSSWMYAGAYQVPTPTLTGDVGRDISLIEEIIGVGEVAISDHRTSFPSTDELIRLVEHARVGGMLGGKAGIINIHMGDAKNPFQPIHDAVAKSELKYKQFLPTHCNRNDYIFEDAKEYGKKGYIDITASSYPYFPEYEIKPSKAIVQFLEAGVPLEHITMTSDANGSLPDFDENGNLVKLEMGQPRSVFDEIIDTITEEKLPIEKAIKVATSNVADILKLKQKGRILVGKDADLVMLDSKNRIYHMIANGNIMVKNAKALRKGAYE
ncbi:MAG: beta-aspartyl-peptidase [Bacteroidetes bacterium]|mgnify:CR=1 FL=1|jgi:beta-aspartyl-dipeptidase (metallo-type)|nr:beta-aspartyl-peptidase [Bacteroidota bacterium]MBT6686006.1 beta-aspartyl-peptidase [Bacteroidota bacterium]MBT7143788.1 beta-aspartyl-peptidase [Bacteroidota bacterium]MBT7490887.1 beta-aspartyl-peptidase [Bacteroidota bacterium]